MIDRLRGWRTRRRARAMLDGLADPATMGIGPYLDLPSTTASARRGSCSAPSSRGCSAASPEPFSSDACGRAAAG
jgi:hypothetical protein